MNIPLVIKGRGYYEGGIIIKRLFRKKRTVMSGIQRVDKRQAVYDAMWLANNY